MCLDYKKKKKKKKKTNVEEAATEDVAKIYMNIQFVYSFVVHFVVVVFIFFIVFIYKPWMLTWYA